MNNSRIFFHISTASQFLNLWILMKQSYKSKFTNSQWRNLCRILFLANIFWKNWKIYGKSSKNREHNLFTFQGFFGEISGKWHLKRPEDKVLLIKVDEVFCITNFRDEILRKILVLSSVLINLITRKMLLE